MKPSQVTSIKTKMDAPSFCMADESVLSAEQLLQYCKSVDKSLPKAGGSKYYVPTGEWFEQKQLDCLLRDRFDLLSEPRHAKLGDLVQGEWNPKLCKVIITKSKSKLFQHMGIRVRDVTQLYPEEALFAMEMCSLEVHYQNVPLTLKEAYAVLLPRPHHLRRYQVYAHLSRLGYTVILHQGTYVKQLSTTPSGNEVEMTHEMLKTEKNVYTKVSEGKNKLYVSPAKNLDDENEIHDVEMDIDSDNHQSPVSKCLKALYHLNEKHPSESGVGYTESSAIVFNKKSEAETLESSSDDEDIFLSESTDHLGSKQVETNECIPDLPLMFRNTSFISSFLPTQYAPIMHQKILGRCDIRKDNPSVTVVNPEKTVLDPEVICLSDNSQSMDQNMLDDCNGSWTLKAEIPEVKTVESGTNTLVECSFEAESNKVAQSNVNDGLSFPNFFGKSVVMLTRLPEHLLPINVKPSQDFYQIKRETFLNAVNTKPRCYKNRGFSNKRFGNWNRNQKNIPNWSKTYDRNLQQKSFQSRVSHLHTDRHDFPRRYGKPTRWDSCRSASDISAERKSRGFEENRRITNESNNEKECFNSVQSYSIDSASSHHAQDTTSHHHQFPEQPNVHKDNKQESNCTENLQECLSMNHNFKQNFRTTYYSDKSTVLNNLCHIPQAEPSVPNETSPLEQTSVPCIDLSMDTSSPNISDKIILPEDCSFVSLQLGDQPSNSGKNTTIVNETSVELETCSQEEDNITSTHLPLSTFSKDIHSVEEQPQIQITPMAGNRNPFNCNDVIQASDCSVNSPVQHSTFATRSDTSALSLKCSHEHKNSSSSTKIIELGKERVYEEEMSNSQVLKENADKQKIFSREEGNVLDTRHKHHSKNDNARINQTNHFQNHRRWKQDRTFSSWHPRKRVRREDPHGVDDYPSCITKLGMPVYSWNHYKFVLSTLKKMQNLGLGEEKFLYTGSVHPLVHSDTSVNTENMMTVLRIVPQVNLTLEHTKSSVKVSERKLTVDFDVYLPNVHYRLSCPTLPNLRLVVVSATDPVPVLSQLVHLQLPFQDGVPAYFAVVGNDDVPAFYGIHDITLPDFVTGKM